MKAKQVGAVLPKLLLTIEEAAQVMNLSRSLMYDLILTKQIESLKIGRARRVAVSALSAYVSQQVTIEKGGNMR